MRRPWRLAELKIGYITLVQRVDVSTALQNSLSNSKPKPPETLCLWFLKIQLLSSQFSTPLDD